MPVADPLDTGRHPPLEKDLADLCAGDNRQVGPFRGRLQKCRRGTGAPAPANSELIGADAERAFAIEIGIARQAELGARLDPCRRGRIVVAQIRNVELAEPAVILALAAAIAFVAAKVRQHLAVAPTLRAETVPIVEILVLTAD